MFVLASSLVLGVNYSYAGSNLTFIPNKIKVIFDSITIHDDRDGGASGDGEFDLSAFVHGKRVDLTGGTGYSCIIWGRDAFGNSVPQQAWCEKLMDAEEGATYSFNPGTEITVNVPGIVPLSLFTVGDEVDRCGRPHWPGDDDAVMQNLIAKLNDPSASLGAKETATWNLKSLIYDQGNCSVFAEFDNDLLVGKTKDSQQAIYYNTPEYGKGSHEEGFYHSYTSDAGSLDFTLRYTVSVTPPRNVDSISPHVLEQIECNNNLPVNSVTSSSSQPTFPPTNAIDNNLSTKWFSTNTLNPFITLNLGSPKSVCSVDIAWADGNSHQYRFNVTVSNDGNVFTNVFSGINTGTTTSPEKYTFTTPQQANFVKITITQSTPGSPNSIAQISEIDLFGGDLASSKPPRIVQPEENLTFSETRRIQSSMNLTN